MAFPTTPTSGKGGKVSLSFGDGAYEASLAMTKQASYSYKGEVYANRIYLLGTGKTLINMRPAVEPRIDIDGIIDGLICTPTASNDEVQTSAGSILVDGVVVAVAADTSIAVSRPASGEGAWMAIHVNKSTGAVTATKGKDTTGSGGKAALLDTYGDPSSGAAGARPLIATTELLIALVQLDNGAKPVAASEIEYSDRETADIDTQVLPNIGGVLIPTALVALHVGAIARQVKFTGYYLDAVMGEVGTAKSWTLTPSTNQISESTFNRNISATEVSGWTFSFEQLAADSKAKDIILNRQGYAAVRLEYPNGGYWQSAATLAPTFNCATGAINSISVSGSLLDDPTFT
jgi:hypothetical protein